MANAHRLHTLRQLERQASIFIIRDDLFLPEFGFDIVHIRRFIAGYWFGQLVFPLEREKKAVRKEKFRTAFSKLIPSLDRSTASNQLYDQADNGDHEQNMNKVSERRSGKSETECPKHQKYEL